MIDLLYMEINAFGLFVILLMLVSLKKSLTMQYGEKLFFRLLVLIGLLLIIDTVNWLINGSALSYAGPVLVVSNTAYFFQIGVICLMWLLYLDYRI